MTRLTKRLTAMFLCLCTGFICIFMKNFSSSFITDAAYTMTWAMSEITAEPETVAVVNVHTYHPVAIKSLTYAKVKVDAPLTFSGVSDSNIYNAKSTYTINENTMTFGFNGTGTYSGKDGDLIFKLYVNVPVGCPEGRYEVKWIETEFLAVTNKDVEYTPRLEYGIVNVVDRNKQITTTTSTAETTAATTTVQTFPATGLKKMKYGDANCDGKVTVADAVAIMQHIGNRDKYGLSADAQANADVNGVAGVTAKDALVIQQVDAGIYKLEDLPLKAD